MCVCIEIVVVLAAYSCQIQSVDKRWTNEI